MSWQGLLGENCRSCCAGLIDHGASPGFECPTPRPAVSQCRMELDVLIAAFTAFGGAAAVHMMRSTLSDGRNVLMIDISVSSDAVLYSLAEQLGAPRPSERGLGGLAWLASTLRLPELLVTLSTSAIRIAEVG